MKDTVPDSRPATRPVRTADVLRLAEAGVIAPEALGHALRLSGRAPTAAGWIRAIDRLFLGVGATLLLAGVICVVAYNWSGLGRWGRFGLAQLVLLAVVALAAFLGPGSRYGRLMLTAGIVLVGPLLALFGQTYQTGADLSTLFRSWAFLTLPWVFASCFAPAWLVWLVIAEGWLALHVEAFDLWWRIWFGFAPTWLLAGALNAAALVAWEAAARQFAWMRGDDLPAVVGRSGPWLIAMALLGLLTGIVCARVVGEGPPGATAAPIAWFLVLAAGYRAYRVTRVDLVMLALGWISVTVVLFAVLLRFADRLDTAPAMLVAAGMLVASSVLGRQWLERVASGRASPAKGPAGGRR